MTIGREADIVRDRTGRSVNTPLSRESEGNDETLTSSQAQREDPGGAAVFRSVSRTYQACYSIEGRT